MRAFDLHAPLSAIFVMFMPAALSRVLRLDADGDGRISDAETKAAIEAMRDSPTLIGSELEAADVRVWFNGNERPIVGIDRVPEYDGDLRQAQYVLQIFPKVRPPRGVWHEIKVEVRSKEQVRGRDGIDSPGAPTARIAPGGSSRLAIPRLDGSPRSRGRRLREPEATRASFRRLLALPARGDASYRLKLIVTVMITGTATPLRSVGLYSHWRTASSAA
jgi:hypothetical protein